MSFKIAGNTTGTLVEVETTSKAARVILYDAAGNACDPVPTGSYLADIGIRHTGTDAAASCVWALRNPAASSKTLYVRSIRGNIFFDGTASAGTSNGYDLFRFSGGDPTTGTTIVRVGKRSSYAASAVLDANAQQKSGVLTMTSVTKEAGPFATLRSPTSVTGTVMPFNLEFALPNENFSFLELAPGEGVGLYIIATAIVGQGISGTFEWDER